MTELSMTARRHTVLQLAPAPRAKRYLIVHRVPQLTGDPEYAVVEDSSGRAEAIALFFDQGKAKDYIALLEKKPI